MNLPHWLSFGKKVISLPQFSESTSLTITGRPVQDKITVTNPGLVFQTPRVIEWKPDNSKYPLRVQFVKSEYDLDTIANAIQLDGLLHRCVNIYVELILKNNFEILSPAPAADKHIKNRLREIQLLTNIKFTNIIDQVARQLVSYGNAFIIKVRKSGLSDFAEDSYEMFGRTVKPIVGLFVADASTMHFGLNQDGMLTHYKQAYKGSFRTFPADNVIHIAYNKIPGVLAGMSSIIPILDDIRALRKLEEEIEILGFQYAVPLYLYQVGTDAHPAGTGEVDGVAANINKMPTAGMLVVPHTHNVKVVNNENNPVDVMKFIEHFKTRAISGFGISPVALGHTDTSNRNTSEVLDLAQQNTTKSYQQLIKDKIEQEFLVELLYDGKYDPQRIDAEMRFPEIDIESQIKKENHIIQKYTNNMITLAEAREEGDYSISMDKGDLYINNVQIPLIEAKAEADLKVALAAPKPVKTATGSKMVPGDPAKANSASVKLSRSAANRVASKDKPTNQHGQQLSRPKIKRDVIETTLSSFILLSDNLLQRGEFKSPLNRENVLSKMKPKIESMVEVYFKDCISYYKECYRCEDVVVDPKFIKDLFLFFYTDIVLKIDKIKNLKDDEEIKLKYAVQSIVDSLDGSERIENLAKIIILYNMGQRVILFKSDDCSIHQSVVKHIKDLTIKDIPPSRFGCRCSIEEIEENDEQIN